MTDAERRDQSLRTSDGKAANPACCNGCCHYNGWQSSCELDGIKMVNWFQVCDLHERRDEK